MVLSMSVNEYKYNKVYQVYNLIIDASAYPEFIEKTSSLLISLQSLNEFFFENLKFSKEAGLFKFINKNLSKS